MSTWTCPKCGTMIFSGPLDPPGCPACGYLPQTYGVYTGNTSTIIKKEKGEYYDDN